MSDLIGDRSLQLTPKTTHCFATGRNISWVSTTELPHPEAFLRGDELVMTTGLAERSEDAWRTTITRLAELPIAALCFGTGLVHQEVPHVVVETAEKHGLAVLESPMEIPFIQISRWVADRIFAEQYAAVRTAATIQDELVRALLAGDGLRGLLRKLHKHLGGNPVAVIEPSGNVLAQHPTGPPWPADTGAKSTETRSARLPVTIDQTTVAHLSAGNTAAHEGVLSFAASVLGLELARHQAVLTGRRELVGQVVEDIVNRVISEPEAQRRLVGLRLPLDRPQQVIIARVAAPPERLRRLPWAVAQLVERRDDHYPTAVIQNSVVLIVDGESDGQAVADDLAHHLRLVDPHVGVGIGQARRGISGLRVSYFEARQACQMGSGVQHVAPLSLSGLLIGNLDLPLRELGETVLAPLFRHDAEHGSVLLPTLRSYLNNDCSPTATARELTLHRNSLRYRLQLVEQLTSRDLARMTDRIELWFALAALQADPEEPDTLTDP